MLLNMCPQAWLHTHVHTCTRKHAHKHIIYQAPKTSKLYSYTTQTYAHKHIGEFKWGKGGNTPSPNVTFVHPG